MKGFLTFIINFFTDDYISSVMNIPLLVITLIALLVSLWICIAISKKNKLYINRNKDKKDNAYT